MRETNYLSASSRSSADDIAVPVKPARNLKKVVVQGKKLSATGSLRADPNEGCASDSIVIADAGKGRVGTQLVRSAAEADALLVRLQQLESESSTLAQTLAKVCSENASLAALVSSLEAKVSQLAESPLQGTSVLQSLFQPEAAGWFGGSKRVASEQLEELCESLQNEFLEYKASHASSNDEIQALMTALTSAHNNATQMSKIVKEQQQALSAGPFAVTVRIVSCEDAEDGIISQELQNEIAQQQSRITEQADQLRRDSDRLELMCKENAKLQEELMELRSLRAGRVADTTEDSKAALKLEIELQKSRDEIQKLHTQLEQLREALATEECLHNIKKTESEELSRRLEEKRAQHRMEVDELKRQLEESRSATASQHSCSDEIHTELERVRTELRRAKTQLVDAVSGESAHCVELQAQLLEAQAEVAAKEELLQRSMPLQSYQSLEAERGALVSELELYKKRVAHLEGFTAQEADREVSRLDEMEILQILELNKERTARLKFECEQVQLQLQEAQKYALRRDEEAQRLERASAEDKQRVTFLLKKCTTITEQLHAASTIRDTLSDDNEKLKMDIKQLQRQLESQAALQSQYDALKKEKQQMESRLSAAEELEEKLIKAKETIAYMELTQSRSINMSQYAELQAAKEKLENTMGPLKRQLEEVNRETERLRAVTRAQQIVTDSQLGNLQNLQDQVTALSASEAKQRERANLLSTENERLGSLNAALETQMTDMQNGIREMAMQMEKERSAARTAAEAACQKQVSDLTAQLKRANDTIASVQASESQFVAEGLYQSTVAERDSLLDDLWKRNFEQEKLKSEISIYRQTIADLEAENDEHVKEMERLQDHYQAERAALAERLSAEQKRVAELSSLENALKEKLSCVDAKADQDAATIKSLEETNAKHKRAFEDKCRHEEQLNARILTLQSQLGELPQLHQDPAVGEEPATAVPDAVAASDAAALAMADKNLEKGGVSANRLYQLQCENDRLQEDLTSLQLRCNVEADESQRTIQQLQMQLKSRMSADGRAIYEAEMGKSLALKQSNTALLKENELLKKKLAEGGQRSLPGSYTVYGHADTRSTSVAAAGELQMMVIELQEQLVMQRESLKSAEANAQRVQELEAQLQECARTHTHELPSGLAAGSTTFVSHHSRGTTEGAMGGDFFDATTQSPHAISHTSPVKQRAKKIKKKTLAEQVAAAEAGGAVDILSTSPPPPVLVDAAPDSAGLLAQLQLAQTDLLQTQDKLHEVQRENLSLKNTIDQLSSDLHTATAAMDKEHREYKMRSSFLEDEMQQLQVEGSRVGTHSLESQMRLIRGESDKLRAENESLRHKLDLLHQQMQKEVGSQAKTAGSARAPLLDDGARVLQKLRRRLQQKDVEIKELAEQLVLVKNKLAEYMAMADRLGVRYPFPLQLEGATVMRLRATHLRSTQRAESAPMPSSGAVAPEAVAVPEHHGGRPVERRTHAYRSGGASAAIED